ncbi:hypothetical protein PAPYR_732 [Paratrimastix pyriformis]|uniref:Uncharacterized protein n=1 Tax=Paratrimastix pyriformis TaxID=342808 RepID=A0ABQ8UUB6_9EUKA|nr:hypothetical protein PAPYR_732 [Paratrimastix pyriformis]
MDVFGLLPLDVYFQLIETNPCPISAYCCLLALTHATRQNLRGSLRFISFRTDNDTLRPTASTITALVAPCADLYELELPQQGIAGCGMEDTIFSPWVDATFERLEHLKVLRVPTDDGLCEAALCRILGHRLGASLETLEIGCERDPPPSVGFFPSSPPIELPRYGNGLLSTITAACPALRTLLLRLAPAPFLRLGILAPLGSHLTRLVVTTPRSLGALLPALKGLESLEVYIPPGTLPLEIDWGALDGSRLRTFRLPQDASASLPTLLFAKMRALEALDLVPVHMDLLGLLCGDALERVSLSRVGPAMLGPLAAMLVQLPALADLSLCPAGGPTDLPPTLWPLVGRLTRFHSAAGRLLMPGPRDAPGLLRAPRLRALTVHGVVGGMGCLLDCPALTQLVAAQASGCPLTLRCPALESLDTTYHTALRADGPMPRLSRLRLLPFGATSARVPAPAPLVVDALAGAAAGLRVIEGLLVDSPAALVGLLTGATAPRVSALRGLVVRQSLGGLQSVPLGGSLEELDIKLDEPPSLGLHLWSHAGGLRQCSVHLKSGGTVLLHAPSLWALQCKGRTGTVDVDPTAALTHLDTALTANLPDLVARCAPTLQCLRIEGACLPAGPQFPLLRRLVVEGVTGGKINLAQFPRLAALTCRTCGAQVACPPGGHPCLMAAEISCSNLALALGGPRLARVAVCRSRTLKQLTLDAPALEGLLLDRCRSLAAVAGLERAPHLGRLELAECPALVAAALQAKAPHVPITSPPQG